MEINSSKSISVQILCKKCKTITKHSVLSSKDVSGYEDVDGSHFCNWKKTYQIIQCLGCETISFRIESSDSDSYDEYGDPLIYEEIFPKRAEEAVSNRDYQNLPFNLHAIYHETMYCYENNFFILCAVGIRALVEGICQHKNISGGMVVKEKKENDDSKSPIQKWSNKLDGKINGLVEKGYLTQNYAETLHEFRFLGNEAVHELTKPYPKELSIAIKIIDHILDSLYEIPSSAMELKQIRVNKKKASELEQKEMDKKSKEIIIVEEEF